MQATACWKSRETLLREYNHRSSRASNLRESGPAFLQYTILTASRRQSAACHLQGSKVEWLDCGTWKPSTGTRFCTSCLWILKSGLWTAILWEVVQWLECETDKLERVWRDQESPFDTVCDEGALERNGTWFKWAEQFGLAEKSGSCSVNVDAGQKALNWSTGEKKKRVKCWM